MKVLLVNKFYYRRGGDCTAVFHTEQLLKAKGHEVAVFSTRHPQNEASRWETYFAGEVRFASPKPADQWAAAVRLFHSGEVARRFRQLLADFKPDLVHLHNIHSYLSPLVAQIAHGMGIRTVWTLHDYKLICPAYACLRDGKACEVCFRDKGKVVRYKCMKNSYIASLLACMEARYWNREKLSRLTDTFISPSSFLKTKMVQAGFASGQIDVLPNFMPFKPVAATEKEDYYCYVGRLSAEKGIDTLLEAADQLPYRLKIIGGGPLLEKCRRQYPARQIEFTGQLSPETLYPIVQKARFIVIPSVCYENNPFSAIEALCMGTPVLGSRIGGIPELIEEGRNGELFTPGDRTELKHKINAWYVDKNAFDYEKIASAAYNKYSSETFYNKLMKIYNHS